MTPIRTAAVALALLVVLASCSSEEAGVAESSTDAPTASAAGTERADEPDSPAATTGSGGLFSIEPADTAADLTEGFGPHVLGAPDDDPRGELLVFLPGTGGDPTYYETFLEHARGLGYHVLGLAYPNAEAVNFDLCVDTDDRSCPERARREIMYGIDAGDLDAPLDVTPGDSAVARLIAALEHAATQAPDQGWDAYLDDAGEPEWASIATAGHSQGGGHAAYLGLDHELARVLLFDATEPAPWTQQDFATPPDRMWGIAHADEPIVAGISRSWVLLDLPGEPTNIDGADAEPTDSHRMIVTGQDCTGDPESFGYYHGCPITDLHLPDPVPESLTDAWTRMLTG